MARRALFLYVAKIKVEHKVGPKDKPKRCPSFFYSPNNLSPAHTRAISLAKFHS